MEFLEFDRVWKPLTMGGVVTLSGEPPSAVDCLQLDYEETQPAWRMMFSTREGAEPDVSDAEVLAVPRERAGEAIEHILHKLHFSPLLLFPIGTWRDVFEVVSPALLDNAAWMDIDTSATIKLNTRDPLRIELRDLHTVRAVLDAVLGHATALRQGVSIAALAAPLLIEVDPECGVLLTTGSEHISLEARAVVEHLMSD